jgi:tetratricopeptide (TPR) repeat protein
MLNLRQGGLEYDRRSSQSDMQMGSAGWLHGRLGRARALGCGAILLVFLAGPHLAVAADPPVRGGTLAEKTLKEIVARQRDILGRADREGEALDVAWLRGELQSVINSYDILIQKSPEFAPAYVAYGMLLGQVGMTREAVGILLKANRLDKEIPVVKNELARFLAEDGKLVEALPWLMAAIELEPQQPLYHYHLGKLLTEGREEFIKTGQFTRTALDRAMLEAFGRAAELAPTNFAYAYRAAEAYYDLETPQWDAALARWRQLEAGVTTPLERQTLQLHQANVLLKQGQPAAARALITGVSEPTLAKQRQTLLDQHAKAGEK